MSKSRQSRKWVDEDIYEDEDSYMKNERLKDRRDKKKTKDKFKNYSAYEVSFEDE